MRREKARPCCSSTQARASSASSTASSRQGIVAGLDIGEFQNVADLGVQVAARLADVAGIFAIFGMAGGAVNVLAR